MIVDGEKWNVEKEQKFSGEGSGHHIQDNPEIIDDWPLHPAGDISTKTTIGACWQGMIKNTLINKKTQIYILSVLGTKLDHLTQTLIVGYLNDRNLSSFPSINLIYEHSFQKHSLKRHEH